MSFALTHLVFVLQLSSVAVTSAVITNTISSVATAHDQLLEALCTQQYLDVDAALASARNSVRQGEQIDLVEMQKRCSIRLTNETQALPTAGQAPARTNPRLLDRPPADPDRP